MNRHVTPPGPMPSPSIVQCRLGALTLELHREGAAFEPESATLLVADLHLEKGSAFAARGQMLPPYATLDTLTRLHGLAERLRPRRIVLLGDSFHSSVHSIGPASPAAHAIEALGAAAEMIWIAGNHDPAPPFAVPGRCADAFTLGDVVLRHLPARDGRCEIVGHHHPTFRLATRAGGQRRRCFLLSPDRLMLPAFGALTGGIDARDPVLAALFPAEHSRAVLICSDRLHAVPLAAG